MALALRLADHLKKQLAGLTGSNMRRWALIVGCLLLAVFSALTLWARAPGPAIQHAGAALGALHNDITGTQQDRPDSTPPAHLLDNYHVYDNLICRPLGRVGGSPGGWHRSCGPGRASERPGATVTIGQLALSVGLLPHPPLRPATDVPRATGYRRAWFSE